MSIRLGPVLYAGASDADTWRFSIQIATDVPLSDDGALPWTAESPSDDVTVGEARKVADFRDLNRWSVWQWPVEAARGDTDRGISYRILDAHGETVRIGDDDRDDDQVDDVVIPARGRLPRIATFSCNGFGKKEASRDLDEPERVWQIMGERHRAGIEGGSADDPSGFHLLIGTGDQLYADGVDTLANDLDGLYRLSKRKLARLRPSAGRQTKAQREYLELYARAWGNESIRAMMSRVPGLYTWDDHDVMDGWGSHGKHIQENVAYLEVYAAARRAFLTFQLAGDPDEGSTPPRVARTSDPQTEGGNHLLQSVSFREADRWVDVLALDLRSHRTKDRVLSEAQWKDLKGWLDRYVADVEAAPDVSYRHLLLVSTMPLVYRSFRSASWVLGNLIPGTQNIEDDLIDQWEHRRHQGERERLIMTLLAARKKTGVQITVLSGDVHVAARGRIVSTHADHLREGESQVVIQQVISSGIVHPPPTEAQHFMIGVVSGDNRSEVGNGVYSEPIPMDTQDGRLRVRNFASLGFDSPTQGSDRGRLWVEWVAEDEIPRRQLVVEP